MKDPKTVFVISSDFCHWGPTLTFSTTIRVKVRYGRVLRLWIRKVFSSLRVKMRTYVCGRDMNVGVCCLYGSNGNYDLWS